MSFFTGWTIADPIASFCISIMIFLSAVPLLRSSAHTLLQRTPRSYESEMRDALTRVNTIDGVLAHRDAHFWAHSSAVLVGSLSVQIRQGVSEQKVRAAVTSLFKERGVTYLTVQIERDRVNPVTGLQFGGGGGLGFGTAPSSFSKPATMNV